MYLCTQNMQAATCFNTSAGEKACVCCAGKAYPPYRPLASLVGETQELRVGTCGSRSIHPTLARPTGSAKAPHLLTRDSTSASIQHRSSSDDYAHLLSMRTPSHRIYASHHQFSLTSAC